MKLCAAISLAIAASFATTDALALTGKTFVSGAGNDTNTSNSCSKGSPCRTLAAAYGITVPGGQIVVIDTAVYAGFTITTPISISAPPGVTAIIQVGGSQTGFTVSAGATDPVVLRNLQIFSTNPGSTGINHTSGRLVVDHVQFSGLTTGMVSTAKSDIIDSDFWSNTTGLQVTGTGCDPNTNLCTTVARVSGGSFIGNTTALTSNGGGVNGNNNPQPNIIFFQAGGVLTNSGGNATFISGDTLSGNYSGGTNPH